MRNLAKNHIKRNLVAVTEVLIVGISIILENDVFGIRKTS